MRRIRKFRVSGYTRQENTAALAKVHAGTVGDACEGRTVLRTGSWRRDGRTQRLAHLVVSRANQESHPVLVGADRVVRYDGAGRLHQRQSSIEVAAHFVAYISIAIHTQRKTCQTAETQIQKKKRTRRNGMIVGNRITCSSLVSILTSKTTLVAARPIVCT